MKVSTNALLEKIKSDYHLKNDAALADFLEIGKPMICRIHSGKAKVSGDVKITIHYKTGMSIFDIEKLAAKVEA